MKRKLSFHPNAKNQMRRIYRMAQLNGFSVGSAEMTGLIKKGVLALRHIGKRDTFSLEREVVEAVKYAQDLALILEDAEGDLSRVDLLAVFPPSKRETLVRMLRDSSGCESVGIPLSMISDALSLINSITVYAVRMQRMGDGDYRPWNGNSGFMPRWGSI